MKTLARHGWIAFSSRVLPGLLLGLMLFLRPGAAAPAKLILALGDSSYVPVQALTASTGAEITTELGHRDLLEFAVVILSNIPYGALPRAVQEQLPEFLSRGGSLLITGGPNSYGSGGYQPVAPFIPFEIRAERDWIAAPFKAVIPLQPNHPILAGVTFRTVGNFNDLNPKRSGVTEIARYAGGAVRTLNPGAPQITTPDRPQIITTPQGEQVMVPPGVPQIVIPGQSEAIGAKYPSPLIAEQPVGQGTVLGIAFDIGREISSGWTDGPRFVQNALAYLVRRSPLIPRTAAQLAQVFSQWQEECDRRLRKGFVGGMYWKGTAADCRREMVKRRFPYMDLADLWLARRLAIAEEVDKGELSHEKEGLKIGELNSRIRSEIEQRQETAR
ncbi:MAG: hypothetical protein ACE5IQ_07940 [Candidatus Methylomirabilales bacterium]